jgi:hypothetical protein
MMKVYRVEQRKRKYQGGGGYLSWMWSDLPCPQNDLVIKAGSVAAKDVGYKPSCGDISFMPTHYVCGAKHKKQLQKWFPKHTWSELKDHNYKIVELEVPDEYVIIHKHQVIFDRRKAKQRSFVK